MSRINFCCFDFWIDFDILLDDFVKCKIYNFIIKLSLKNLEFLELVI